MSTLPSPNATGSTKDVSLPNGCVCLRPPRSAPSTAGLQHQQRPVPRCGCGTSPSCRPSVQSSPGVLLPLNAPAGHWRLLSPPWFPAARVDVKQTKTFPVPQTQQHGGQQDEGGDSPPLLHFCEIPPGALHPALGSLAQGRHGAGRAGSEEPQK